MNADMDYAAIQFSRNAWGQLVIQLPNGSEFSNVDPIRCFPLSDPHGAIAILDAEGRELINLSGSQCLNATSRETLNRELAEREFAPVIRRIAAISNPVPPCCWEVETDRGYTSFQLESEDDLRRVGNKGLIISDSNGVRYKIESIEYLDPHSQKILRRLV